MACRAQDPRAAELGARWLREGRLAAAARDGLPLAQICLEIWQEIGAAHAAG